MYNLISIFTSISLITIVTATIGTLIFTIIDAIKMRDYKYILVQLFLILTLAGVMYTY